MTQDEYRRRIAEAWRALESKIVVPSLADYLDAIRPLWRQSVPVPVRSGQRSGNGARKRGS
jgi:hypothetical protein